MNRGRLWMLLAGICLIAGALLPWRVFVSGSGSVLEAVSGYRFAGRFTVIACVLVVAIAVLAGEKWDKFRAAAAAVLAAAAGAPAIWQSFDLGESALPGAGVYVTLAGAALTLAGAWAGLRSPLDAMSLPRRLALLGGVCLLTSAAASWVNALLGCADLSRVVPTLNVDGALGITVCGLVITAIAVFVRGKPGRRYSIGAVVIAVPALLAVLLLAFYRTMLLGTMYADGLFIAGEVAVWNTNLWIGVAGAVLAIVGGGKRVPLNS